jgi:proteasome lid subunit RPN8/RPN11
VLLGNDRGDVRTIAHVVPVENLREDSRHNRYVIPPERFLAAEREARSLGLDVVGFFHSHPDHPPEPSRYDREHAWPFYTYLIVSVREGRVVDAKAWRLAADRERFEPEAIETSPDDVPADAHPARHGDIQ